MKQLWLLICCLMLCACTQYDPQYYTSDNTGSASTLRPQEQPMDTDDETDADEVRIETTVKEYAQLLYPDHRATKVALRNRAVDGTVYIFAEAYHDKELFCTIVYDAQREIYYLYDSEVNQLIPIEYDADGIRLVG